MNKVYVIACRACALEMYWLSETAYKHLLATGIAGQGCVAKHNIVAANSPEGLGLIRLLKQHIDGQRRALVAPGYPRRITIYPTFPTDLPKDMYKAAYRDDDPPVASRVTGATVARLAFYLPRRSSKRTNVESRAIDQCAGTPCSTSTGVGAQTRLSFSASSEASALYPNRSPSPGSVGPGLLGVRGGGSPRDMLALPSPHPTQLASAEGAETKAAILREEKARVTQEVLDKEFAALQAKAKELEERENILAEKEQKAAAAQATAAAGKKPAAPAAAEGQDAAEAAAGDTPASAAAGSKPAASAAAGGKAVVAAAAGRRPAELATTLREAMKAKQLARTVNAEKEARPAPAKKKRKVVTAESGRDAKADVKDDEQEDEEDVEKEQEEQAEAGEMTPEPCPLGQEKEQREAAPEPGQSRSDGPEMPEIGGKVMYKGATIARKEGSFRVAIPKTVAKLPKKFEVEKKYGNKIAVETAFTNALTYVDERL